MYKVHEKGGKPTKYMDKSVLPFGDDYVNYVDKMGDIDIDSQDPDKNVW